MRKVSVLVLWCIVGLTGVVLVLVAPRSWECTASQLSAALYNPATSAVLVVRNEGRTENLFQNVGDAHMSIYILLNINTIGVYRVNYAPSRTTILTIHYARTATL